MDYDIDKCYIMGYSVSQNGKLLINDDESKIAPYLLEDAQKNKIVDNIFRVILDPKNQINLTEPISTDRMKSIAAKSEMGRAAKYMNGYDPSSKYRMQIENATGKTVIGNVATGIKSFFALSNMFNTKFDEIYNDIINGDFITAENNLKQYIFTNKEGNIITLANVNMDKFKSLDLNTLPESLATTIKSLIEYLDNLQDISMVLGELLNIATDFFHQKILK